MKWLLVCLVLFVSSCAPSFYVAKYEIVMDSGYTMYVTTVEARDDYLIYYYNNDPRGWYLSPDSVKEINPSWRRYHRCTKY